jgi:hypothetical protein
VEGAGAEVKLLPALLCLLLSAPARSQVVATDGDFGPPSGPASLYAHTLVEWPNGPADAPQGFVDISATAGSIGADIFALTPPTSSKADTVRRAWDGIAYGYWYPALPQQDALFGGVGWQTLAEPCTVVVSYTYLPTIAPTSPYAGSLSVTVTDYDTGALVYSSDGALFCLTPNGIGITLAP